MIGIHGRDHRDIGVQLQKTTVILIRLYYTHIPRITPEIAVIIDGDASQKSITAIATMPQDMGDHGRDRRLPMGAGNTDIKRTIGDHTQHIASLQYGILMLLII